MIKTGDSYCIADSIELKRFAKSLSGLIPCTSPAKDVLVFNPFAKKGVLFVFSYGAVVFWNVPKDQQEAFLARIAPFSKGFPFGREHEGFDYEDTIDTNARILDSCFYVEENNIDHKMAISYGLAQSVKISALERVVNNRIESIKHIPEQLAKNGRISLSRRDIAKEIGRLFLEKSSMTFYGNLLDTPEFFWEEGHLEPLYHKTCKTHDLDERIEALNTRFEMVQELYNLLSHELQHQHSSFLEWVIIALIAIEILLFLLKDLWHVIG